ncbi:uncharacterized protein MELLADRAFT_72217, partial [Melampsora larici-populina 98AG31]
MIRLKHERLQNEWDKREAIQKAINKSHLRPLPPSPLRQPITESKEERTAATNKTRRGTRIMGPKSHGHDHGSIESSTHDDLLGQNEWAKSSNGRSTALNTVVTKPRPSSDLALQHNHPNQSNSKGFSALRTHLSKLISNPSQPHQTLTHSGVIKNLIFSIKSFTSKPLTKYTLISLSFLMILKSFKDFRNRNQLINRFGFPSVWSLVQFIQWVLKKMMESFQMGTRFTYL